jgi:hypothetical protein
LRERVPSEEDKVRRREAGEGFFLSISGRFR